MPFKVISRSTKVVDFGTNRKRVYDFLLVINSNHCRISHPFGDTATYWSKIANSYPPHPHSTPSLGVTPFEFWDERDIPQSMSVTDRQTDRQTDRITITNTVQRIASHGKNRLLYSKICYIRTTKVEMIKFATIMANCVLNNL